MTDNLVRASEALKAAGCEVRLGEPMRLHTSFKIGGPADIFAVVSTEEQLSALLGTVKEYDLPLLILGNGSNMLVSDDGIRGVVAKMELNEISVSEDGTVRAGAGASLAVVCRTALDAGLTGLEFAFGIPGTLGGAAYMNAGAYGGELKNVVESVEYITRDGEKGVLSCDECGFGYRMSVFQSKPYIVTAVNFKLEQGDRVEIKAKMDDVMERRRSKQPLELPSAGSVFKRPEGYFAGTLIEQCGLKGATVGGAQVSTKHAGFIVNIGGATCEDVLGLVKHIQDTVREAVGVELECEIRKY